MRKALNIQPQVLPASGSVVDLLNGALSSLSGPVGFTLAQPRIHVKQITVTSEVTSPASSFAIYKGASGGSVAGTAIVADISIPLGTTKTYLVDTVLDSTDFLTGRVTPANTGGAPLVITVTADIEF